MCAQPTRYRSIYRFPAGCEEKLATKTASSCKQSSVNFVFYFERSCHKPHIRKVNRREGKVHLRKLPAIHFPYDDCRETQHPDELLTAPQLVHRICPAAQDMEQLLFGTELRVIDESFNKLQV